MSYVLKLCSWYPSKMDHLSGDFVQRHAIAIATQIPVVVVFATKDLQRTSGGLIIDKQQMGQLTEIKVYYPRKKWLDKIWSQWFYMKAIRKVLPEILKEKGVPMLVHLNIVWKAAMWANLLYKKYSWPIFITENSTEYQPSAVLNIRHVGPIRQNLTKAIFQRCIRFIPVSNQLAETVNALYGNIPYSVVPNAVNTSLFFPEHHHRKDHFNLLHISTLTWQKNPVGLLRVFDQLLQAHHDINITIVGPITELLEKWMEKWKHRANDIICTGLIPYEEVAEQLREADLLVLFSRYENLPCVILEAHCAGIPVVSTNVGGISEVINSTNGLLVNEGDEPAFLQAIELVKSGSMLFDKSVVAKNAISRYNYQQIGLDFLQVYRSAGISV